MKIWLIDSRSRSATKKRFLYSWPTVTKQTIKAVWKVVLKEEVTKNDRGEYAYLYDYPKGLSDTDKLAATKIFHDYWAEYGWDLILVEDDAIPTSDMIQKGPTK
jgi:hypothetical protein